METIPLSPEQGTTAVLIMMEIHYSQMRWMKRLEEPGKMLGQSVELSVGIQLEMASVYVWAQ